MTQSVDAAPRLTPAEARAFAERAFGVRGAARPLSSERDQNFAIERPGDEPVVLKLANAHEDDARLEFQAVFLERLGSAALGFEVPRLLAAPDGRRLVPLEHGGRRHAARLLTWVPGHPLGEARTRPLSLLADVGRCLGRLSAAVADLDHPGGRRELKWDLRRAGAQRRALRSVGEAERRALAERRLDAFEEHLGPALEALPDAAVHGDWHEHNVLLSPPVDPERRVVGAVDFGDASISRRVCDPAIAVAYAMLGRPDPLAAACAVTEGFCEESPLDERELALLWELARMRLVMSVLISAEQARRAPDNPWLRVTERPAWELLDRLEHVSPAWAHYRLRSAAGYDAHPARRAALAALEAADPAPVMDVDLKRAPVLDMGVGSPDFSPPASLEEVRAASAEIARRIAGAGAEAALGRYDEARVVYTADAFRTPAGPEERWRTVHLGIDMFAQPGATVRTPFDAEVASFADNAAPLDYGPTIVLRHRLAGGEELLTLYGHLSRESLEGLEPGQRLERGAAFATLGDETVNGGWAPHLHFQLLLDDLGHRGDFPGVAAPEERQAWLDLCPDPNLILRVPGLGPGARPAPAAELIARRRAHGSGAMSLSYRAPLVVLRGRGTRLFDPEGRPHLDAVNNIAHVGHSHPRVVEALSRQAALLNTNTRYLHPLRLDYVERLAGLLPAPLSVVFLVCSGSEANELALRLARARTGGRGVIVLGGGYHGNTTSLVEMSPYKYRGRGGQGPGATVYEVPAPDPYRGPHRGPDAGARYAAHVADAARRAERDGTGPASFFAESLPGCAGQLDPPPGFLEAAYAAVRRAGGVCVADEVQVGFGRVGERFWGFELHGVVPDIVTLGKPMGNGHPIGAVVTTPEVARFFETGMEYFNSFGGNPVSCAVGQAVLDVIEDEGLQGNAQRVGARLRAGLGELAGRHPLVGEVRGRGLYLGVELVRDPESREPATEEAAWVVDRARELGVLISRDGPLENVLKIKPPLVFSEADAERLLAVLDVALGDDLPRARLAASKELAQKAG